MDAEIQRLVQSWLIALGPWVLSGVVALLAFLGKRLIDKQDALDRAAKELGIGYAVLSERVDGQGGEIKRHQKWLEQHQEAIHAMKSDG